MRDLIYILMLRALWEGEKSYLAPVMSRKEKKAATVPTDSFVFNNFRLSNKAFNKLLSAIKLQSAFVRADNTVPDRKIVLIECTKDPI